MKLFDSELQYLINLILNFDNVKFKFKDLCIYTYLFIMFCFLGGALKPNFRITMFEKFTASTIKLRVICIFLQCDKLSDVIIVFTIKMSCLNKLYHINGLRFFQCGH